MKSIHLCINNSDILQTTILLQGTKYHHLVRVRRVKVGAILHAVLPEGRILEALIAEITSDTLTATIIGEIAHTQPNLCRVTLYQAILKGEKMDMVVQKATELGITRFVPLITRRTVPHWSPEQALDRAERWQRISDAAREQCERAIPVQVEIPVNLQQAAADILPCRLVLHERKGKTLHEISTVFPVLPEIGLFIGPEGGWADEEIALLQSAEIIPLHIGGNILRAETASLVAVTLAQYIWGPLAG